MLALVLIIYISLLCFISYFFQKPENNRLKKKSVDQNFVILLFCFCLKQDHLSPQANKLIWSQLIEIFDRNTFVAKPICFLNQI